MGENIVINSELVNFELYYYELYSFFSKAINIVKFYVA